MTDTKHIETLRAAECSLSMAIDNGPEAMDRFEVHEAATKLLSAIAALQQQAEGREAVPFAWANPRDFERFANRGLHSLSVYRHGLQGVDFPLYAQPQPTDSVEMSPEFTDSARAAIAWVLYHHQGGSSPVGQPLRFALGMGAHDRLPEWRIAEARKWAELVNATTADFHSKQPTDTERDAACFDFAAHLERQREFSEATFGPGPRTAGVVDHIRKELIEVEAAPYDGEEWIDVVILALDGAWRSGLSPEQIIGGIVAKQTKNEGRTWPDWRTADPSKAIEHDRTGEEPQPCVYDDEAGSWGRQSEGWPSIHDPNEEARALVIAKALVPHGSYVTVGERLRLRTPEYVEQVRAAMQGEG